MIVICPEAERRKLHVAAADLARREEVRAEMLDNGVNYWTYLWQEQEGHERSTSNRGVPAQNGVFSMHSATPSGPRPRRIRWTATTKTIAISSVA
jgi:hypothetical protein